METINELFFKELENSGVSKVTIKNYKSDLKNFFSWFIDVLQSKGVNANSPQESLPFVESDTVKSYKNYLESISSSASTINRRLSALRKFGTFLNDTRATESNLFESVANVTKDDLVDKKTLILEKYLQKLESSKISTNTIKNYKADINQFLGWSEKNLNINFSDVQSINRINSESIKNYIRSSLVGASPSTIDRKLSSLKSFFSYLVDSNMAKNNPATNLINKTRGSKLLITPPARVVIDEKGSGTKESITALFAGNILAQRILNNLFNKRPKWFRRYQSTPISQYINLSLLFIIVAALAIGVYDTFFAKTTSPFAYPATPQRPNRYLSFQGRLTNQYNTPLTTAHSVTFKLWDHATNATEVSCDGGGDEDCLWTSQTCTVTPDQDGIFNVLLGTTSGDGYTCSSATEITSDVFSENSEVWLGITVETETMTSRVQIATVAYALNAETLQGFPIDASGSATKSTVVTMNQYGGIVLGEVGPRIRSVAGDFTIEGQTLNLQTAIGGNGNINLSPDGTGSVNITSSAQSDDALYVLNAQTTSGAVIHGYYSGAGTTQNLIRLGSGASETDRFWVTSNGIGYLSGRLGIGVTAPTQQLHVAGNMRLTGLLYDYNNETGSDGQILSKISGGVDWIDPSSLSIPAAGGWTDDGDIVRLTTVGNRVGIGTTSVHASTKLGILGGVAIGSQTYSDAQAPTNGFIVEGNVGIGITNPLANLHIYDSTTDGSSIIRLQNDAQSWQLATAGSASDYFILRNVTGSTDVMRIAPNSGAQSIEITSTGVGIGKVPGYKLDVNGAANFGGALTGITTITTSSTINSQTISSAASFTGTLYSAGKITSGANNAAYFRGGDDAEFFDINVANTTAIYGIQNSAVASLKLGSGGGTLSGYGGNIGIGYTTPGGQLEVRNTTAGKVTLDIQHASTTLSQYYAVASFTTRSAEASDRYLIYAGRLDSGGGFVDGEFRVNTNGAAYADGGWNGAADFAEYFNTDDTSLDKGEIVSLVPGVNKKVKRANNQNVGIFGVVSTQPGFVGAPVNDITEDINEIENNPNWKIVGVLGQVPTYVNNENGEIKAGDPITLSSQPGIGAKSNGEGQIVGRAMEGYNSSTPGKIMVLVQPTWYDPDVALSADGSIQIINQDDNSFIVEYSNGQKANRIASFAKVFTANINAGFTVTKELVVKNSASFMGTVTAGAIEAGNITAQGFNIFQGSVDNLLVRAGLVSPTIQTGLISPLADENEIRFQVGEGGKLAVNNANGDEVASISDTGEIKGSSVKTYNANVTGELRAQRIIASEILDENGNPINQNDITLEDIETLLAAAETDQQMLTDSGNWNINTTDGSASITDLSVENLFVTGNAAMSSLSLTTSLTVGSDLVIASSVNEAGLAVNNIDTLSSPLKIQALALAPVEIMSGLFKINTNGNVEITGNLYVAGRVNSKGITLNENSESGENLLSVLDKDGLEKASVTASGSATFNDVKAGKLIVAGSTTEVKIANENGVVETNSPVGQARIVEGEIEVAIINVNVTENTLVYVTPVGSTQNKVLFVKSKEPGKFTVGISSPATKDIDFNWWVVETSN